MQGDPDRCDNFGNTALHWAAARGHINCVSFLVNFGANLWALDNEYHSAKDVAAVHRREEVLRYLDDCIATQSATRRKQVARLKEKAVKDVEKRLKIINKLQNKALKRAEKETLEMSENVKNRCHIVLSAKDSQKYSEIVNDGYKKCGIQVQQSRRTVQPVSLRRPLQDLFDKQSIDVPDSGIGEESLQPEDSIGSAGSLARRSRSGSAPPVARFLASQGLLEYVAVFLREKIDLDALTLLTETDLRDLGLPLGPRRKLGRALELRKAAIADPGCVLDSRL
ncbi:USH1G [Cordylochernes scorpioides]|uniref:NAD(+) ADP-ribosyltransferase n=1 Tax=Cordylochernes scorpioides TaxID=51811 RepID=A0ABY6KBZ0_9ARAC|nr:USH1G [Cordylochernes scorpioides]